MESRFRILFLVLPIFVFGLSGCAATKNFFGWGDDSAPPPENAAPEQVVDPQVQRQDVKEPDIDSENFEIGAFGGIMSVEDFGSDVVYGFSLTYHVTEGFFIEGDVGKTTAGLTSFEILSGGAPILSDDERDLIYYSLNVGYNILPGEAFVGQERAYNTGLYIIAGLGSTQFAGDDRFTVNFGAGYRFIFTDSFALHMDFRDYLFDIDVLGEEKTAHNLQGTLGLTFFF
jgi:outer membrane beta-barrel protein